MNIENRRNYTDNLVSIPKSKVLGPYIFKNIIFIVLYISLALFELTGAKTPLKENENIDQNEILNYESNSENRQVPDERSRLLSDDNNYINIDKIEPEYYLYNKFDKNFKIIVSHEFFKDNLEKIEIQEYENPSDKDNFDVSEYDGELKPKGSPVNLPFQRAFSDDINLKFSRSDLFWPNSNYDTNAKQKSFENLGLEVLSVDESATYNGKLQSSMVYFESVEFNAKQYYGTDKIKSAIFFCQ